MFSDDISMEFDLEKCASASSQENKLVLTGNILLNIDKDTGKQELDQEHVDESDGIQHGKMKENIKQRV